MFDNYDDILNVNQVIEILNIGRTKLYRMLATKEIRAIKVGTKWKIPKASLEDFVKQKLLQE